MAGVNPPTPPALSHGLLDGADQLGGGAQRATLHDRSRNGAAVPLLAELPDQRGQPSLVVTVHDLRGGGGAVAIHAHIQRLVTLEREAAPGLLELQGGDAEVE